jgi:hypothetical protein
LQAWKDEKCIRLLFENLKERHNFKGVDVYEWITLRGIFGRYAVRVWT